LFSPDYQLFRLCVYRARYRGWSERFIMHLCHKHAEYAEDHDRWQCLGQQGIMAQRIHVDRTEPAALSRQVWDFEA